MAFLDYSDHPAIRAALDVSLDDTALPDDVIVLSIYTDAAELEVKARDADAASRTGDARQHIKNAAILLCAALLAPAVPQIAGEQLGSYRYTRQSVDWSALAADLRGRAYRELELATKTPTPSEPETSFIFALAKGKKRRC